MPEEKIVSREVIGSSNPFAKFFRSLAASIKGIAIGLLLIIASLILIYFFANQKEHSKVIEALPLQTPAEVENVEGMVKIHGEPNYSNIMVSPNTNDEVLYYTLTEEEYAIREVQKTRTITEDGQEIKETYIVYEPDWETTRTETEWSEFKLGPIEISPQSAQLQMNTKTFYEKTEELTFSSWKDNEDLVNVPQKKRVTIKGVSSTGEIIVVGSNSNNRISSGEEGTFFLSNKSDAEFTKDQAGKERTEFWIMVAITWILMTTGFTMLLGPISKILNLIPGLGDLANSLLFIVFGIISAVIIFIAYIGLKFWWIILIGLLLLIAWRIFGQVKKGEIHKPAEKKT